MWNLQQRAENRIAACLSEPQRGLKTIRTPNGRIKFGSRLIGSQRSQDKFTATSVGTPILIKRNENIVIFKKFT